MVNNSRTIHAQFFKSEPMTHSHFCGRLSIGLTTKHNMSNVQIIITQETLTEMPLMLKYSTYTPNSAYQI